MLEAEGVYYARVRGLKARLGGAGVETDATYIPRVIAAFEVFKNTGNVPVITTK